ncbi:MAG: T9SS type A sorting domain-containing protein [Bacteroidales bacterium]|nr:T9SS type A sorting domain-containing protein [Bacteroidales bacterium]
MANGITDDNSTDTLPAPKLLQVGNTDAFDASLQVYPNPTDDLLYIELSGGAGIANMALYDLQGRVVGTRFIASATGASATVNMRDIPAGVYVLRVTDTDGKEYHRKIVRK